jgi:uncharacterized membrane protein YheB (UPF0754 family)
MSMTNSEEKTAGSNIYTGSTDPEPETSGDSSRQSLIGGIWELVVRHSEIDTDFPDGKTPDSGATSGNRPYLLAFLMSYPYLLLLLLIFALFWDFDGISWNLFGKEIIASGLLRILAVSGLIGFLTNWIAIEMLFRPRRKHPLLRQGLIPAQKERVALKLANAVARDLINPEHIRQKMTHGPAFIHARTRVGQTVETVVNNSGFRTDLKNLLGVHVKEALSDPELRAELNLAVQDLINNSLRERYVEWFALKVYTGIKGRKTPELIEDAISGLAENQEILSGIVDRVLDRIPPAVESESANLQDALIAIIYHTLEQVDLRAIVEENLNRLDEEKLEQLIKGATNTQLNYIKYLGAIIGTIGGFVIWSPLESLAVLAILAAGIFSADWLLIKIRNRSLA